MKKDYNLVIAIIACLLVVVCLFQINGLKEQIAYLESNLNSRITNIESNQNSNIAYVNQKLEEHASLLASSDWNYDGYDLDTGTVQLRCSVTPKEYSPGVTKAVITINGSDHEMTANGGEFILEADIPLFDSTSVSKVVFTENDTARTEALDWFIAPRSEYIPVVTADFSGEGYGKRSSDKANTYVWHREGEININADCYARPFEVVSISLVEEIDGVETARTNIPLNTESYNEEMVAELQAVQEDNYNGSSYHFYHAIDRGFEIPFGGTMELYVELVDDDGLVYRAMIEHWEIDAHGEPVDDDYWWYNGMEAAVYDENGNALFIPEVY